jgi:hypothetical protein
MEIAMKIALTLLLAVTGVAQPLRVYSEFARIDAQGEAVAPESPRAGSQGRCVHAARGPESGRRFEGDRL